MHRLISMAYLFIILLLSFQLFGGEQDEQIMTAGVFHGDEVSAEDGEEWYVLYSKDNRVFLENTSIKLTMVEDVILDEKGQKTGKEVTTDINGNPILLLKNFSNLSSGEVASSHNQKIYFFEKNSFDIKIGNNSYQLKMNILDSKAELVLSNGIENQTLKEFSAYKAEDSLYMFGDEAMPSLLWAGDLDRDGKPDLLMDISAHYNLSEIALFLSSHASNGELVKKAAVFRTVGC